MVINALDTEFGTSTGANVNVAPGLSRFDYPPSASTNLVISSLPGDSRPYSFAVGDHYRIQWGASGSETILGDATILRSDFYADGHVAVVFEGTDQNGGLTQVVWAPYYNLDQWYWNHFTNGVSPEFYATDQLTNTYAYPCFAAGTQIAVPGGSCAVERLRPGDLVETVDHGPQPLLARFAGIAPGLGARAPVRLAPGALGNRRALVLTPQHRVLLTGPDLALSFGADEMLAPVAGLDGAPGIDRVPVPRIALVHLLFARHELVLAEGAVVESLLAAPGAEADLVTAPGFVGPGDTLLELRRCAGIQPARPLLKLWETALIRLGRARAGVAAA